MSRQIDRSCAMRLACTEEAATVQIGSRVTAAASDRDATSQASGGMRDLIADSGDLSVVPFSSALTRRSR